MLRPALAALVLVAAPQIASAARICVETLAGVCLRYEERREVSPAEQAEDALGLTQDRRRTVQRGLRAEGLYQGTLDGLFGPATRQAIRAWQSAQGARATGFLSAGQADDLMARAARPEPEAPPTTEEAPATDKTPTSTAPATASASDNIDGVWIDSRDGYSIEARVANGQVRIRIESSYTTASLVGGARLGKDGNIGLVQLFGGYGSTSVSGRFPRLSFSGDDIYTGTVFQLRRQ